MNLLLVDDDEVLLKALRRSLTALGYEIATCSDGAMVLDAIAKGTPSMVILDVMLPGKDGFSVLREIRERYPELPPAFKFIFEQMISPLGAAFYSMVAYYLLSAAYRTFRARSVEATALLLAGIIVMLGRAPIGEAIWRQFPAVADWIMKYPNLAGSRGVLIGAAVGTVGVGIRIILGIDRGYLGGSE